MNLLYVLCVVWMRIRFKRLTINSNVPNVLDNWKSGITVKQGLHCFKWKVCNKSKYFFFEMPNITVITEYSIWCSTVLPPNLLKAHFPSAFDISAKDLIYSFETIGLLINDLCSIFKEIT